MPSHAKRVALVSLSPWTQGTLSFAFNLAVRRLQAALLSDPRLADCVVEVFEFGMMPLAEWNAVISAFELDVLAASAYLWSAPTFSLLARDTKRAFPDCLTIMADRPRVPRCCRCRPFVSA